MEPEDRTSTPSVASRARRRLPEVSWILCCVAGLVGVGKRGAMDLPVPTSGGYMEYLELVEVFRDPARVYQLNPWRKSTWGALVGGWGELTGRTTWEAAFDVTHVSVALIILGAALLARALAGPVAACAAALVAVAMVPLVESWLWLSPYPALGGATAVALGLGCVGARWKSVPALVGAALAGGLALALDGRGVAAPTSVLLLSLIGAWGMGGWRRLAVPLLCAGLATVPELAARSAVADHGLPHTPLVHQVLVHHGHAGFDVPEELLEASVRPGGASPLAVVILLAEQLGTEEASRFAWGNIKERSPGFLHGWSLLLLLLALVPSRAGPVTSSLSAAATFLPSAVVLFVSSALVGLFFRYTTPYWALTLGLAPVAAHRVIEWVPRRLLPASWQRGTLLVLAVLGWSAWGWPGLARGLPAPDKTEHTVDARTVFALTRAIEDQVQAGDAFYDCYQIALGPILPRGLDYAHVRESKWRAPSPLEGLAGRRRPPGSESGGRRACREWLGSLPPQGPAWLVFATHPGDGPDPEELGVWLRDRGWTAVPVMEAVDMAVWHTPGGPG